MPCQLVESSLPTCDFRTQPTRDKTTESKNMTKEEVINRLKHCIQQQDPVFKEQFLSISKEPDAKICLEDFRKVGTHAVWGFLPDWVHVFHPTATHTSFIVAACLFYCGEEDWRAVKELGSGA